MRDWFAHTFPSLARLDGPKWVMSALAVGMVLAIGAGVGTGWRERECVESPAMPAWCPLNPWEPL